MFSVCPIAHSTVKDVFDADSTHEPGLEAAVNSSSIAKYEFTNYRRNDVLCDGSLFRHENVPVHFPVLGLKPHIWSGLSFRITHLASAQ